MALRRANSLGHAIRSKARETWVLGPKPVPVSGRCISLILSVDPLKAGSVVDSAGPLRSGMLDGAMDVVLWTPGWV